MPQGATEKLAEYQRKRNFERTLEPAGAEPAPGQGQLYVMHHHAASHDHFDLRLESDGVLRSWALPKGPSLEPGEKRLAVEVEDHPLDYGGFEGVIPQGEYGGGTVMLWDTGRWRLNGKDNRDQLDFVLEGEKLQGAWTLVRTSGKSGKRAKPGKSWLLIKRSDKRPRKLDPGDFSVATGRTMTQIAKDRDNTWVRGQTAERPDPPQVGTLQGARKKALPQTMAPQLATLTDRAPNGEDWIHEIKFDGYRLIARKDGPQLALLTRNGHDWTARFPELAAVLARLPVDQTMIDGELVAIDKDGSTSFRKLQEAIASGKTAGLVFQAFDLLHVDAHDLTRVSQVDRKQALAQLLAAAGLGASATVRYVDHLAGNGPALHEQACVLGLEGIICKRADSRYRSGRGRQWLKVKCTHNEELVVGGFTEPGGARGGFGSLLLGAYREGKLIYAGRVGTGFSARQLERLRADLDRLEQKTSPFNPAPKAARGVHWVKPQMVVAVEFTERTRDGRLRHPAFRGVREDREPQDIALPDAIELEETPQVSTRKAPTVRSKPATVKLAGIAISNPDRVMYPEQGLTKLDLARYYVDIQDWVLPWLANRPLSLLRCPEGWETECFFQKHPGQSLAASVPRVPIEESKGIKEYAYIRSISDIVAMVQMGVLEFHPWGSQVDELERPDMMIFDLDPAVDLGWNEILRVARALRDRLDQAGLASFVRTTGGKGLHLVVPLEPAADWDQVKAYARALCEELAQDEPDRLTTNMAKAKRRGRIFLDYLRNGRGATAIGSYSIRARAGAPVAVPLRWEELGPATRGDRYSVDNIRRRLGALKSDPWEGFFEARVALDRRMLDAIGIKE